MKRIVYRLLDKQEAYVVKIFFLKEAFFTADNLRVRKPHLLQYLFLRNFSLR